MSIGKCWERDYFIYFYQVFCGCTTLLIQVLMGQLGVWHIRESGSEIYIQFKVGTYRIPI